MVNTAIILDKLKTTREEKGLKQNEIAKKLGVDRTTYLRKENGQIPISTQEWLILSRVLKEEPSHFFMDNDYSALEDPHKSPVQLLAKIYNSLTDEQKTDLIFSIRLILKGEKNKDATQAMERLSALQ